ncbi:uncharacterized protein LOC129939381 isoform X1 [Eupeodes corollae]|uniref:uncharacterized protein LOC129939381 isoform X1 n=1 Tax=Eupeodes corollae TaxID=290404 RepID=UPI002492E3BC|nr:uncharacterized protein LOC129939381 isoform X1 [Eupeodes corollae]
MALASGSLLKAQTPLQQLLEDINFQRTKEMRQLLKDECGFVVLQGTTYWTDLFVRHFLFQSEPVHSIDSDDLLFFVRKKHVKSSSRHMPKYETEVDVFRKDSRKLPIGDPDVDWEETVYLNMVIHQFDYTLTLAICTRTSPKELQVLRRHSQRVYASPSRRKMDTKGEGEEMTYPHICFMVDNFDEVFSDILVRDGEMVCVELVANDKDGSVQGVIFLGSIRYDALKKVYDARQSSLSSKVAQRMSFGLFSSGAGVQTRCEFVRMKGPQGKGHAEMAVTKPKGSGVETPTSEPGFCATDMWEDWDEDPDDYYNYRHQRRLSDPSANLNNFSRYGWRAKNTTDTTAGSKARSENEGLDSLASEVSEIEAGDLRDDLRPAFSASEAKLNAIDSTAKNATAPTAAPSIADSVTSPTTGGCVNCFGRGSPCKRWSDTDSAQMSEVYCRACEDEAATNSTPACLNNMPNKKSKPKHKTILSVESELVVASSSSSSEDKLRSKKDIKKSASPTKKDKTGKCAKESRAEKAKSCDVSLNGSNNNLKPQQEYEIADDATSLNGDIGTEAVPSSGKIAILSETESKLMISVRGKEELPVEQAQKSYSFKKCAPGHADSHPLQQPSEDTDDVFTSPPTVALKNSPIPKVDDDDVDGDNTTESTPMLNNNSHNDCNGNNEGLGIKTLTTDSSTTRPLSQTTTNPGPVADGETKTSTLPRAGAKKSSVHQNFYNKALRMVPKRRTPDGTDIYYWCDLPKKALKELDDGAYNPLWATRGFTQTFHFWKENRRQQSTPLNAFLTYVTLPWWSIAKDLLDHRETPILTF